MELHIIIQAVVLGLVEGLTEFIPVSSTGHLILLGEIIGFHSEGRVFEIAIQLGAILAICWKYREKLIGVACTLPTEKKSQNFALNIVLAFLPAAVIGVFAHSYIKEVLFSPIVVSVSLIVGGVIILIVESLVKNFKVQEVEEISWKTALKIGFFQALAMIPGVSRSGATIMGAMTIGVGRKAATEFSFFLAIPTMLGATVYDLYKNWALLELDSFIIIAIGFVTAFLAALLVVSWVIDFVTKNGFKPFAYYRIVVGVIMLCIFI